jgi:hypothetical protein
MAKKSRFYYHDGIKLHARGGVGVKLIGKCPMVKGFSGIGFFHAYPDGRIILFILKKLFRNEKTIRQK